MTNVETQAVEALSAASVVGPLPAGVDENDVLVDVDAHASKLAAWKECNDQIKFWKARLERIQAELSEVMGNATVGLVSGEAAVFHRPQERFSTGDFRKAYPDMYKLYTREMTKRDFDPDWLRQSRPDLWSQFQVRSWRNTFDA